MALGRVKWEKEGGSLIREPRGGKRFHRGGVKKKERKKEGCRFMSRSARTGQGSGRPDF